MQLLNSKPETKDSNLNEFTNNFKKDKGFFNYYADQLKNYDNVQFSPGEDSNTKI